MKRHMQFAPRIAGMALVAAAITFASMTSARAGDPKVAFERYTLPNGLEVILHQDKSVPIVNVNVWYHVGSGDEVFGRSGFAHLFEHMLFQGSKNVGEDRHFAVLKNIGATGVNGTTNTDRTNYFEVVPSHQIETALWLESDRMGHLLPILTKKSLDNQIEVVRNERRQRVDNVPYGPSRMKIYRTLFPLGHPYHYSVIGSHKDLSSASLEDVKDFYRKWYVPANATLVVAGDFETAKAKELVKKWFGSFPKAAKPAHRTVPTPQTKASRTVVPDKFAKLRQVTWAWHSPRYFQGGDAEMDIVASTLGSRTGRLYRKLVLETQLAQNVRVYQDSQQLGSVFIVQVRLKTGADMKKVEAIMEQELAAMRQAPISDREFKRVLVQIEASFVWRLESLSARANLLQRYNHYVGTPGYITQDLDRYRKSSPAKVRDMAAKYLVSSNRVDIITMPARKKGGK